MHLTHYASWMHQTHCKLSNSWLTDYFLYSQTFINSDKTILGEGVTVQQKCSQSGVKTWAPAGEDSSGGRLRGNLGYNPDRGQPQGPTRRCALPGPVSARLCAHPWLGLSRHPTVGMVFPAASHSASPSSEYTMAIAWLAPGSNGLLLMSRTNRSHCLFFICQRFNYMDSAPIKAASLKLRPHSWTLFSSVSSVLYSLASKANREKRERTGAVV